MAGAAQLAERFGAHAARESAELDALPALLDGCKYIVDVGANNGLYLYHAAKAVEGASLVAVEANPDLAPRLAAVIDELRRSRPQNTYAVVTAAVYDRPGTIDFFVDPSNDLSALFAGEGRRKVSVPAKPLDDFFRPDAAAFVKIDVEGAEYRALTSARRFIAAGAVFFVELHGWGDRELRKYPIDVCWFLCRKGYGVSRVGTHFVFRRAPPLARYLSLLRVLPWVLPKSLAHRFAPSLVPALRRLRTRLRGRASPANAEKVESDA
jgi:FkbM family methyltransferase